MVGDRGKKIAASLLLIACTTIMVTTLKEEIILTSRELQGSKSVQDLSPGQLDKPTFVKKLTKNLKPFCEDDR